MSDAIECPHFGRPLDFRPRRMLRAVTRRTEVVLGRRRRTWGYLREMHREGGWTWDQFDTDIHAFEFDAANAAREVTR